MMPTKEGFKERIARNMGIDPIETANSTAEQIATFLPQMRRLPRLEVKTSHSNRR